MTPTTLAERDLQGTVHLEPVRCMAGCKQPCNVSLTAPGKLTFILSNSLNLFKDVHSSYELTP